MSITVPHTPPARQGRFARILGLPAVADRYPDIPAVGREVPEAFEKKKLPERTGGVLASARRLTRKDVDDRNKAAQGGAGSEAAWQNEAWDLLDEVGEQRFLAHTLAGRMAQASLYVGRLDPSASPGTRPEMVDRPEVQELLDKVGGGHAGQSQLLHRLGLNLLVAGEVWLVGIPAHKVPGTPEYIALHEALEALGQGRPSMRQVDRTLPAEDAPNVLDMVWQSFSVSEISVGQDNKVSLKLGGGETIEAQVEDLWLIRIWRPHPRRAWEADSPTRASLPVLRELVGLTQHVSAQIDSRLAGAGVLFVPSTASAALKRAAGLDENSPEDPLVEGMIEAMMTPISDRSSASAVVPLTITVPDEVVDKIKHVSFASPLDKESPKLRDEAIRRLALGQDAPPELLLGTGGMNHWGAWLVREDVVTTHLEPPLRLICDALTDEYLRPLMLASGYATEETVEQYVVWYDVDHLIARPNRSQDAKDLHAAGVISDKALREANGFEEGDAPAEVKGSTISPAVQTALDMVAKAPSLAQNPGLPALVEQLEAVLSGAPAPSGGEAESTGEESSDTIPDTAGDAPPAGTPANP